jgi:hypothetical protein
MVANPLWLYQTYTLPLPTTRQKEVSEMDSMTTGHGSRRTRSCLLTSSSGSRYTKLWSKCPRSESATRNCGTWFGSLKFAAGISTFRTEESLSRYSAPYNSQLKGLVRIATSLALWAGDEIVAWLVSNGLQEFDFGNACIMLERISARTRATVWVRKKSSAVMVRISERTLNESEIQRLRRESPYDYDELTRRGSARVNIPILPEPLFKKLS